MRIGVLGGGQLGRMLGLAAHNLGLRLRFLDREPDAVAGQVGDLYVGACDDPASMERFARGLDLVTYEFENVPLETARFFAARLPLRPPLAALEASQDRLTEKRFFRSLDIPTAEFVPVESIADLRAALVTLGTPAILKTRRLGYDGKGQSIVRSATGCDAAWAALGGQPLILERVVEFSRELSLIAVRSTRGETRCYPLIENVHREGILRRSTAPAEQVPVALQQLAERHAGRALADLEYVGVLAIEFFQVGESLIANEMAPRVHNSGHWTIDAAVTSQFENHLRAVAGWPLGDTAMRGVAEMVNLIGTPPATSEVLSIPGTRLHLYGKSPRPGRKLGHVTIVADDPVEAATRAARLESLLAAPGAAPGIAAG